MMLTAQSPMGAEFGAANPLPQIPHAKVQERTDLCTVLITTTDKNPERIKAIGLAVGCSLPAGHGPVVQSDGKHAIWLTPRSWLILCDAQDEERVLASVASNFKDHSVIASRYADALCWLSFEGAHAAPLLAQGSFVSFTDGGLAIGAAKRTPIAGIPAVIWRTGETEWTVGVERSRARYFVDWLTTLTLEFGDAT